MPKKYKSHFTAGLETILNNPQTSFMRNPKVFGELHKQSGMSMSEMIRHVGRGSKQKYSNDSVQIFIKNFYCKKCAPEDEPYYEEHYPGGFFFFLNNII